MAGLVAGLVVVGLEAVGLAAGLVVGLAASLGVEAGLGLGALGVNLGSLSSAAGM